MQFRVPQNIDMQDRILGPLTMVQFAYAVIGFGTCYAIVMSIPAPVSYILTIPIALFVLCLDFVKINERPFLDFFIAAIEYSLSAKKRFWQQNTTNNFDVEVYHANNQSNHPVIQHKNVSHEEIGQFAAQLDQKNKEMLIKR